MKKNIWPGSEVNPSFFLEDYNCCMSMLGFLWHLCTFLCLITWLCSIYCIVVHPTAITSSSPLLLNFFLSHMNVSHTRDLLGGSPYAGMARRELPWEGYFWCATEVTPDSSVTFERQLKHKQAPRPAGIAHLLLQIIQQTKRGQRWRKATIVYLGGLCSLLERPDLPLGWEGTLLVPALCTGAELCSGVRGFFVGPTIAPARMCSHGSLCLYPLFWRVCTPCSWHRECCCRSSFSLAVTAPSNFLFLVLYLNVLNHIPCVA